MTAIRSKLEKETEKELCKRARKQKCICIKMEVKNDNHWPDRLIIKPNRECFLVEVKRWGEKPRPAQNAKHSLLRELKQHVYVIDRPEQIAGVFAEEGITE